MRFAIITDVHANYHALKAIDQDVRQQRMDDLSRPLEYWFLGDLIGYGPDPVACLEWLKDGANLGDRWVPGNHDAWLIHPASQDVNPDAIISLRRHREMLQLPGNEHLWEWFTTKVRQAITDEAHSLKCIRYETCTAIFVHASIWVEARRTTYLRPWVKVVLDDELKRLRELVGNDAGTVIVFCGHNHYPMWVRQTVPGQTVLESIRYHSPEPIGEGLIIINPGSAGQPRDGDPRAAYLIFDPEEQTIEFRRVEYPHSEAADALRYDSNYPYEQADKLATRLETADGGVDLQQYQTVYHRPQWDLKASDWP